MKKIFFIFLMLCGIVSAVDYQLKSGATDVTLSIPLYDSTNGSLKIGVTIANLDIYYIRTETDNDVTLSSKVDITALAGLTDAHTDNYSYEVGLGYYRFDFPDAIFAAGATTASIYISDATGNTILPATIEIQLTAQNPYDKADVGFWLGTAVAPTTVAGVPEVDVTYINGTDASTYIESRTLPTADYFNPTSDTVAHVTLVDTTTTNTDMRGTDGAALTTALTTVQNDLDILTGANGVTLATLQPNYAPVIVSDLSGLSTFNPLNDEVDVGSVKGIAVSDINDFKADSVSLTLTKPTGDPNSWTDSMKMYWLFSRLGYKYEKDRTSRKIYVYDANDVKISEQDYTVTSTSEIVSGIEEPN